MTAPTDRAAALNEALYEYARAYCTVNQEDAWYRNGTQAEVDAAEAAVLAAVQSLIDEAVKAERERCARIADRYITKDHLDAGVDTGRIWSNATATKIAAAIRSAP